MKKLLFVAMALCATVTISADNNTAKTQKERDQIVMEKVGGFVVQPRTGNVSVINAQTEDSLDALKPIVEAIGEQINTPIEWKVGEFRLVDAEQIRKELGIDLAIFIVADSTLPMTLCAPEARWAVVNIAPLKADKPTDEKFNARVSKAFARAFVNLLGGAMTKFTTSVLKPVSSTKDLDRTVYKGLPFDAAVAIARYLPEMNISPQRKVTYKRACEEGWAPAPTNEFQRAVWDKVHQIPDKPITIEFDPKTDK